MIDVCFPVQGETIPSECGYALYGALSRVVPTFHDPGERLRFAPVGGAIAGNGLRQLTPSSRLRVRLPADRISLVLPLVGKPLLVGEHPIVLGVPTVQALTPAPALFARLVSFKNSKEPGRFLDVARGRLRELGVAAEPVIPALVGGPRDGLPQRRVLRIKGRAIVGFSLLVEGLTAEESIRLQEEPICGRWRLGCGFFLPVVPRR